MLPGDLNRRGAVARVIAQHGFKRRDRIVERAERQQALAGGERTVEGRVLAGLPAAR